MSLIPIDALFAFGGKLLDKLDKIFPDPQQKAQAILELEKLKQSGELAMLASETQLAQMQSDVNKIEASSTDKFASRWRPFIGWVCGVAFAYHFILQPLLAFAIINSGGDAKLPAFDMDALSTVLMGILGLGGLRTIEKIRNK